MQWEGFGERLERALPVFVAAAAAIGIGFPGPGREIAERQGIEATLAVLVFASAVGVAPGASRRIRADAGRLAAVWLVATAVLPVLAWLVSRMVPAGELRHGVLALGVAPTEVAALAVTSIVGGAVAATAALLVVSTVTAVVIAGPVLTVLAGASEVDTLGVLVGLVVVVALPLAVGLAVSRRAPGARVRHLADPVSVVTVTVLAWLVASQIDWTGDYGWVVLALVAFLVGAAALGWSLARWVPSRLRTATVLAVSMRDFAIAAGIATAAFGAQAAAPLGLYGIVVLGWGALATRLAWMRRPAASTPGSEEHDGVP